MRERFCGRTSSAHIAGSPQPQHGREPWRQNALAFHSAFPDLVTSIDDIFGKDDWVAVRLTFRGTHRGAFFDMPPSGREVSFASIETWAIWVTAHENARRTVHAACGRRSAVRPNTARSDTKEGHHQKKS